MAHGGIEFFQEEPRVKIASTGEVEVCCGPIYFRMSADEAEGLYRQLGALLPESPNAPDTGSAIVFLADVSRRALPFLQDEAAKYEDDGANEPLETLRDLEAAIERVVGASA